MTNAALVLEDGRVFRGEAYGATGAALGEVVFSTGMTGYQETLTDPSYHRQIVVQTAPQIGNTGWNDEDDESSRIWVAGYVVRDPARTPSNWRSKRGLDEELQNQGIVGIAGLDTRTLTRHIREQGAMRAGVFSGDALSDNATMLDQVRAAAQMVGANLAVDVTHRQAVRGRGDRREEVHRRRARPGHQVQHPADVRRARHRGARAAVDEQLDEILKVSPDGRLPHQRSRRPGHAGPRDRAHQGSAGPQAAAVRHLLRQPDPRARGRPRHLQDAVRPPRHQHPGDRRAPARSPSPRRTTGSRWRASRARSSTPSSAGRLSATTAPTTARSRASGCSTPPRSPCSTTPRPRRARTTPRPCSTGSRP